MNIWDLRPGDLSSQILGGEQFWWATILEVDCLMLRLGKISRISRPSYLCQESTIILETHSARSPPNPANGYCPELISNNISQKFSGLSYIISLLDISTT